MAQRTALAIFVFPIILTACATSIYTVGKKSCDARTHQTLVGMNIGEVTLPPNLSNRVINEDEPVTTDSDPRRLNIIVDEKGWINRIYCG